MSELPAGWAEARIRDLASKIGSGATPKGGSKAYKSSGIPLVRSMNIHFSGYREEGLAFIDEEQARKLDNVRVRGGDVLLNITGASIGRVTVAPNALADARVNQHVAIIRTLDGVEPQFVSRFLASPQSQRTILEENYGVTRQALTKEMIENFAIGVPPLAEQRRIVAKLDRLSARSRAAEGHLARTTKLAARAKQAILAAAFRGDLTADWRDSHRGLRPITPRSVKRGRRFAETVGTFAPPYAIPETWRWLQAPELGDLDRGKSRHRPRNDPSLFGDEYPFVQTGDVRSSGQYLTAYSRAYNEIGLAQSRLWPVGTVCITIAANIAETTILGIPACFPDSVVGFSADRDRAVAEYFEFFVRTMRDELSSFAPATAQKNINLETLYAVRVPTPPLAEQAEIVRRIEATFARLDRLTEEASRAAKLLARLDERLLAKAFRGELVPQDPTEEPAEALLARIRQTRAATPKAKGGRRKAS